MSQASKAQAIPCAGCKLPVIEKVSADGARVVLEVSGRLHLCPKRAPAPQSKPPQKPQAQAQSRPKPRANRPATRPAQSQATRPAQSQATRPGNAPPRDNRPD